MDIDSGWSTGFNNFEFDSKKYPNASKMVSRYYLHNSTDHSLYCCYVFLWAHWQVEFFHSKNIRVILWATSMIDTDSSNYQDAYDKQYLIKYVVDTMHPTLMYQYTSK